MSTNDFLAALDLTDAERARVQDLGDSIQITLAKPFTYKHSKLDGERTLSELRLAKAVKGRNLKALDQAGSGEMAQSLALVASLAGVPPHAMDELDLVDVEVVMAVIEPILPKSRRVETSSPA